MRKLTGAVFLSLDGVMQAPGGPNEDPSSGFRLGGWVQPFWDQNMGPFEKIIDAEYDLLLGKRTYDIFAAYWPYNQDNSIGAKFQRINKYVLTHSNARLGWDNSRKLSGDTAAAVGELKRSEGRDLLIQGSSTLYVPLLAAGLIDRLVLMTFPVLLGEGKRIFDGSEKAGALKLVDHFVASTGVITTTYEPAGEVPTGTFETKPPSEAELKRRETWAREDALSLVLYGHPFSSYTWKVLIPLYADGTEFEFRQVPEDEGNYAELKRIWPAGKFPLLLDDGAPVLETTCIIEHLQAMHRGANEWIPEGELGRRVRFLDRFFDLYVQGNMQPAVNHALRPEGMGDAYGAEQGRKNLRIAYDWLEANLPESSWAAGESFTLADCAAAPALFYADWVDEIGKGRPRLKDYRARLLAHPPVARCVEEARPYRKYFPLGAPDRD